MNGYAHGDLVLGHRSVTAQISLPVLRVVVRQAFVRFICLIIYTIDQSSVTKIFWPNGDSRYTIYNSIEISVE